MEDDVLKQLSPETNSNPINSNENIGNATDSQEEGTRDIFPAVAAAVVTIGDKDKLNTSHKSRNAKKKITTANLGMLINSSNIDNTDNPDVSINIKNSNDNNNTHKNNNNNTTIKIKTLLTTWFPIIHAMLCLSSALQFLLLVIFKGVGFISLTLYVDVSRTRKPSDFEVRDLAENLTHDSYLEIRQTFFEVKHLTSISLIGLLAIYLVLQTIFHCLMCTVCKKRVQTDLKGRWNPIHWIFMIISLCLTNSIQLLIVSEPILSDMLFSTGFVLIVCALCGHIETSNEWKYQYQYQKQKHQYQSQHHDQHGHRQRISYNKDKEHSKSKSKSKSHSGTDYDSNSSSEDEYEYDSTYDSTPEHKYEERQAYRRSQRGQSGRHSKHRKHSRHNKHDKRQQKQSVVMFTMKSLHSNPTQHIQQRLKKKSKFFTQQHNVLKEVGYTKLDTVSDTEGSDQGSDQWDEENNVKYTHHYDGDVINGINGDRVKQCNECNDEHVINEHIDDASQDKSQSQNNKQSLTQTQTSFQHKKQDTNIPIPHSSSNKSILKSGTTRSTKNTKNTKSTNPNPNPNHNPGSTRRCQGFDCIYIFLACLCLLFFLCAHIILIICNYQPQITAQWLLAQQMSGVLFFVVIGGLFLFQYLNPTVIVYIKSNLAMTIVGASWSLMITCFIIKDGWIGNAS